MNVENLIILALAGSLIAETITEGEIFAPFRAKLEAKAEISPTWAFFANLMTCPFCLAHHVIFWLFIFWIAADAIFTKPISTSLGVTAGSLIPQVFATIRLTTWFNYFTSKYLLSDDQQIGS